MPNIDNMTLAQMAVQIKKTHAIVCRQILSNGGAWNKATQDCASYLWALATALEEKAKDE